MTRPIRTPERARLRALFGASRFKPQGADRRARRRT